MCVARHLAERRKSEEYEESDAEVVRQTAVEAEDAWDAELQTFQPASRTTGQSPDLALPPNIKASSYIAQYPVLGTVQSTLHFTSLTDLFTQTPSQLLWEASSHML